AQGATLDIRAGAGDSRSKTHIHTFSAGGVGASQTNPIKPISVGTGSSNWQLLAKIVTASTITLRSRSSVPIHPNRLASAGRVHVLHPLSADLWRRRATCSSKSALI
ncbi:MAG: hypothetical protein ABJD68_15150, partial [Nakamurella sp.]